MILIFLNTFNIKFLAILDIEVACYGYEGIDAVKEALRAGLSCSTESMPIKVSGYPLTWLFWKILNIKKI